MGPWERCPSAEKPGMSVMLSVEGAGFLRFNSVVQLSQVSLLCRIPRSSEAKPRLMV
jgi:hypothetical protein